MRALSSENVNDIDSSLQRLKVQKQSAQDVINKLSGEASQLELQGAIEDTVVSSQAQTA